MVGWGLSYWFSAGPEKEKALTTALGSPCFFHHVSKCAAFALGRTFPHPPEAHLEVVFVGDHGFSKLCEEKQRKS